MVFIALLFIAGGSALALWFFVNQGEPAAFDSVAWFVFLALLALGSGSVFSMFGLLARRVVGRRSDQAKRRATLRQGFLLGALLAILGTLQLNRALTYLTGGLAVAAIILVEAYISRRS